MPLPHLSRQEVRLGRFAAFCSALYGILGLLFAFSPAWTFRVAGLGARAELTPEVAAPADWAESAWRAVFSVFATGLPLFALSGWLFHSAAPGVHLSSAPTQSAPELPAPPKPVRLTVGGAKQP